MRICVVYDCLYPQHDRRCRVLVPRPRAPARTGWSRRDVPDDGVSGRRPSRQRLSPSRPGGVAPRTALYANGWSPTALRCLRLGVLRASRPPRRKLRRRPHGVFPVLLAALRRRQTLDPVADRTEAAAAQVLVPIPARPYLGPVDDDPVASGGPSRRRREQREVGKRRRVDDVVVRAVEGEMPEHAEPEHERRRDSPPLVRVERHSRRDSHHAARRRARAARPSPIGASSGTSRRDRPVRAGARGFGTSVRHRRSCADRDSRRPHRSSLPQWIPLAPVACFLDSERGFGSGSAAAYPAALIAHRVSVVIPCLNEAENIEECVRRARGVLEDNGLAGEVIVADNGSTTAAPSSRGRRRDGRPRAAPRLRQRVPRRLRGRPRRLHRHDRRRPDVRLRRDPALRRASSTTARSS